MTQGWRKRKLLHWLHMYLWNISLQIPLWGKDFWIFVNDIKTPLHFFIFQCTHNTQRRHITSSSKIYEQKNIPYNKPHGAISEIWWHWYCYLCFIYSQGLCQIIHWWYLVWYRHQISTLELSDSDISSRSSVYYYISQNASRYNGFDRVFPPPLPWRFLFFIDYLEKYFVQPSQIW